MRGRKPNKPTQLRVLEGNLSKRPIGQDPEFEPRLPDAPTELCEDGRAEWNRLRDEVHRLGLLRSADERAYFAYCNAWGQYVKAVRALRKMEVMDPQTSGLIIKTHHGNVIQNPLVGVANQAARDMVRYATEFGLTPSARARIASYGYSPPKEVSKFSDLTG